jgi:hypothetical protein
VWLAVLAAVSAWPGPAPAANVDEMVSDAVSRIPASLGAVPAELKRVAVYAVEPDREGRVNTSLLLDRIEAVLLDSGRFAVVSRSTLKALMEEQALQLTGAVDEGTMVKTGKLVGVQGFFFGTVESSAGRVVLNLKLISVETGAVVYSKSFVGEPPSARRIGISWGFFSAQARLDPVEVFITDSSGQHVTLAQGSQNNIGADSLLSFAVCLKQGFKGVRWGLFGADLAVTYIPSPTNFSYSPGSQVRDHGGVHYVFSPSDNVYDMWNLSLSPRLYLSGKGIFGWQSDWVAPFAGFAFGLTVMNTEMTVYRDYGGGATHETKVKTQRSAFTVGPVAGLEFNLTQSLSFFAQGTFLFNDGDFSENKYAPEGMEARDRPWLNGSYPVVTAGVKYYRTLF